MLKLSYGVLRVSLSLWRSLHLNNGVLTGGRHANAHYDSEGRQRGGGLKVFPVIHDSYRRKRVFVTLVNHQTRNTEVGLTVTSLMLFVV